MLSDIHHLERKHLEYVWSLVLAWHIPENVLLLREATAAHFKSMVLSILVQAARRKAGSPCQTSGFSITLSFGTSKSL